MALYDTPRPAFGDFSFGGRLAGIYNSLIAWNDARATRNALAQLSDHELDDIGLVRGDIDRLANANLR